MFVVVPIIVHFVLLPISVILVYLVLLPLLLVLVCARVVQHYSMAVVSHVM